MSVQEEPTPDDRTPIAEPAPIEADAGSSIGLWRSEHQAMGTLLETLEPLPRESQIRSVEWLIKVLELPQTHAPGVASRDSLAPSPTSNAVTSQTPKAFISSKKPANAAERIACLAYYLTHVRSAEIFKTADIVALNTEAAGVKFGNAARDVSNAEASSGYIVSAGSNGLRQITSRGEALVEALPDREAIKAALKEHEFKRRRTASTRRTTSPSEES